MEALHKQSSSGLNSLLNSPVTVTANSGAAATPLNAAATKSVIAIANILAAATAMSTTKQTF